MDNGKPAKTKPPKSVRTRNRPTPAEMRLNIGDRLMEYEVEAIERYVRTIGSSLKHELYRLSERLSKRLATLRGESAEYEAETYAEEARELARHFPLFAWQSTFVSIYSLLEDEMSSIAEMLGKYLGVKLEMDDLRHEGIFRTKKYLEALCGLAFPEGKHAWQEVVYYNKIRNVIVHARGRIRGTKQEKTIRKYVGRKSGLLSLDKYDDLEITQNFCLEALENGKVLLNELYDLARTRLQQHPA